jgi:hypothetical protein
MALSRHQARRAECPLLNLKRTFMVQAGGKGLQEVCNSPLPSHVEYLKLAERMGFEPTVRIDRTTAFEF